jgi:hypothetical protein
MTDTIKHFVFVVHLCGSGETIEEAWENMQQRVYDDGIDGDPPPLCQGSESQDPGEYSYIEEEECEACGATLPAGTSWHCASEE